MEIDFVKVEPDHSAHIEAVHAILCECGADMLRNQGLAHWETPYPRSSIAGDCGRRDVYLGKDTQTGAYIHTFQLEYRAGGERFEAVIHKLATLPAYAGQGVASQGICFLQTLCRGKGAQVITLDVYDKSEHAVQFYLKQGFTIVGRAATRRFTVLQMEKQLG